MNFSDRYDTIIFDMDGVITSEQSYWDAAALTIAEAENMESRDAVFLRKHLFYEDRLISLFKERGINSNWDLAYLVRAFKAPEKDAKAVYEEIKENDMLAFDLYKKAQELLAKRLSLPLEDTVREGRIWREMQEDFQHWFLGTEMYFEDSEKPVTREGLYQGEKPLIGQAGIDALVKLHQKGVRLCIATGRPLKEALSPLKLWGILDLFDKNSIATYTHIRNAEEQTGMQGKLTKPHPYIFVKAFLGTDFPDEDIVEGNYKADFSHCLAVGDAGADMLSAQNAGMDFAAVLTGIAGEDARSYFEKSGADYILNTMKEIE